MRRYVPIAIGVALVVLSAGISYWYFFVRDTQTSTLQEVGVTPTPEIIPDFAQDNRITQNVTFSDAGFEPSSVERDAGGQVVFFTFVNNSSSEAVVEFEEKPEEASFLDNMGIGEGEEVDIDFLFPGRYVLVEQNSGAQLVVETQ